MQRKQQILDLTLSNYLLGSIMGSTILIYTVIYCGPALADASSSPPSLPARFRDFWCYSERFAMR